jgi:hypothetical protein
MKKVSIKQSLRKSHLVQTIKKPEKSVKFYKIFADVSFFVPIFNDFQLSVVHNFYQLINQHHGENKTHSVWQIDV